ncbi:hypothetical protein [Caulobacter sp.]|uniref:hypothetical protein n=1 Tax=Caulobacter sp. TaxID=78 RepID=UPI001B2399AC|nr:hypothetical protein [Caulobacter sp.]MBO9546415.1 hypothetical protein [Caulobacter sp.]
MNFVQSRRGFVIGGAALALSGCATTRPRLLPAAPDETLDELEPVAIVETAADALTVRVRSKGCTAKADFVFRVDRKAGHAVVAFARRRLETCKGSEGWANLRFGYNELGLTVGELIVIANPELHSGGKR